MNKLYLDETILQSNTTITLVKFINDIFGVEHPNDEQIADYKEINEKYKKALKKRSKKFKIGEIHE